MQVNASNQAQTSNPLEGLMADKTAAQSAEEAFAAVLAKAGLNVQGGVSASLQAPVTLAPVVDRTPRQKQTEIERAEPRDPQGKTVARGRDDDKATGIERADDERPEDNSAPRAEKAAKPAEAGRKADKDQTAETSAASSDDVVTDGTETAVASQGDEAAQAGEGNEQAALVAEVEENATVVMAAFGAVIADAEPKQVKTGESKQTVETKTVVAAVDGAEIAAAAGEGEETQIVAATPEQMAQAKAGPADADEAVEQAVVALGQMAKGGVKAKGESESADAGARSGGDNVKQEQTEDLARIVGDQGQVKVELAAKSAPTVTRPASALSVGLLAAESQAETSAAGSAIGLSDGAAAGNGQPQNNSGQQASNAGLQGNAQAGLQLGANAVAALQNQSGNFQAALAGAQAGGDGVAEIQGVQSASGPQNATAPQAAPSGVQQPQGAQESRQTNFAQSLEKPHEVKSPVQAKEILDQLNVQISKAAKEGLDKITIQMRPEALGRVEVQLKLGQDGQLSAMIVADKAETLDALKRDSSQLERSLADAGFKTDQGSLQFSLRGDQQNQQQTAASGRGQAFFERGQALDEASAEQAIVQSRSRASARSGVDISV